MFYIGFSLTFPFINYSIIIIFFCTKLYFRPKTLLRNTNYGNNENLQWKIKNVSIVIYNWVWEVYFTSWRVFWQTSKGEKFIKNTRRWSYIRQQFTGKGKKQVPVYVGQKYVAK